MEEEASATTSQLLHPSTLHPSNSPSWSFFLQRLASKGEDPNSPEVAKKAALKENEYRHKSVQYIQHVGQRLRMCAGSSSSSRAPDQLLSFIASPRRPQLTIATAIVFYHRFYLNNSYEQYDRFVIANTCLFLAGKVEETPKKLKDVVIESYKAQHQKQDEPHVVVPSESSKEFWEIKEHVLVSERILLQSLGFDLSVEHPYRRARHHRSTPRLSRLTTSIVLVPPSRPAAAPSALPCLPPLAASPRRTPRRPRAPASLAAPPVPSPPRRFPPPPPAPPPAAHAGRCSRTSRASRGRASSRRWLGTSPTTHLSQRS